MDWKGLLWLSLLSFGAGLTLVATAAYYGSIYMALMAIFSFITGVLLYYVYRAPALFEGADSPDEMRSREARREFVFLISLLLIATVFYGVLANMFYNTFSNTEEIIVDVLPLSFVPLGLAIVLFGFLKRPPESLPQPEEDLGHYVVPPAKRDLETDEDSENRMDIERQ